MGNIFYLFDGSIRKVSDNAKKTDYVDLKCRGTGLPLELTNCSSNYGYTSNNPTISTVKEIIQDVVTNHVNLSYGSANNTGYALDNGLVDDIDAAFEIPYMNFPYNKCRSVIEKVLMLNTAYRNGATAGAHWIVDTVSGTDYLRVKSIGTTQASGIGQWGKYAGGTEAKVHLKEGIHFTGYKVNKSSGEYANNIVLATDFRKPAHDFLCENLGESWGNFRSVDSYELDQFIVGTHSLRVNPTVDNLVTAVHYPANSLLTGDALAAQAEVDVTDGTIFKVNDRVLVSDNTPTYEHLTVDSILGNTLTMSTNLVNAYQAADNAECNINAQWNIEKWGSQKTVPTLNFYVRTDNVAGLQGTAAVVLGKYWDGGLEIVDATGENKRFAMDFAKLIANPQADKWFHVSIPIGEYAAMTPALADCDAEWINTGTCEWSDIDFVAFAFDDILDHQYMWFDDLHFSGKIVREAVDTSEVTDHGEVQLPIISRDSLDDTCIADTDTGMAGAMAHAELLRHVNIPRTIEVTIPFYPSLKPGEYFALTLRRRPTNLHETKQYYITEEDFRVLQYQHDISVNGAFTHVTLTDDLLNSYPITNMDKTSLMNEFMLVNNEEAKNMRSSGEVDLLIDHLRKEY